MSSFLDNDFCKDLKEVKTPKLINRRHYHPDGLFSEQIFGPIKNYTCQCGTYYGISKQGSTCNICGVDIVSNVERRRRFAKIVLPLPVMNPLFKDVLYKVADPILKSNINLFLSDENSVLYMIDDEFVATTTQENIPSGVKKWYALDAIDQLVRYFADEFLENGYEEWKIIKENIDKLVLNEVIVLPPDLRPAAKSASKDSHSLDEINRFYTQILTKKESIKGTVIDIKDRRVYYAYFIPLQKAVNELYIHIIQKLSKKSGLVRGNILGKRVNFSGRAIIVPDPTLNLDECALPYQMFLKLFNIPIAKKLIEIGHDRIFNEALDYIELCIKQEQPHLLEICEELAKDQVCLLNRQPTLHSQSVLGFKIKVTTDHVIKVHPLICSPFNADFDGDQMAVYIPISEETKQEIIDKFLVTKNLISPADESISLIPSQDIVLGIYSLTSNMFPDQDLVECKGELISKGRRSFNNCLPSDYQLINEIVDKKKLLQILNDVVENYNVEIVKNTLDNIKRVGFKYSTLLGVTLSLDSFIIKNALEIRDNLYSEEENSTIISQLDKVSSKDTENFLRKNFNYAYMIESGSRGSWDQVRQIVLTRGFISNFEGIILDTPIKHSLVDGLTPEEFFTSTYGSRKGLLDVALNTGRSGYLSRKLIFSSVNLQIDPVLDDCGTTDTLSVFVKNERKAKSLINRYIITNGELEKITKDNYKNYINKTIQLRSPIFCKSNKICHKCYGDLYKSLNSSFIGIIAAQTLGEASTQLTLRTFHTSGVAVTKQTDDNSSSDSMKQMDIINDLSRASEIFHRFGNKTPSEIIEDLFEVYGISRSIYHVHYECIVSQLMWVGRKKWRLMKDREKHSPEFHSIQSVPAYESWLLGLAFSNPRQNIINSMLKPDSYSGIFDKLLLGKEV
jgi:DNA-directed RNA polymerase subunit beta'